MRIQAFDRCDQEVGYGTWFARAGHCSQSRNTMSGRLAGRVYAANARESVRPAPGHSTLQEGGMRLQLRRAGVVGAIAVLAVALGFASAFAQGTQTGTLSGTVTTADGAVLPGVSITLTSPALQGTRQAASDAVGA